MRPLPQLRRVPALSPAPIHAAAAPLPPCRHGFVTDLLLRCGRGEAAALARLFDLFYRPVRVAVAVRVSPERSDAATAEVFVRIWRRAPGYRPSAGSAVSWIMQEARIGPGDLAPSVRTPAGVPDEQVR